MDKQEIYDKVCAHLAQQKKKAADADGNCYYRTSDGLECAAGCLIDPSVADKTMLAGTVHAERVACALNRSGIPNKHFPLLRDLQRVHDKSTGPELLRDDLKHLCTVFDLTPGAEQAITEWN